MSSTADTGSRLLLVDGHALAYRAFHAIRNLSAEDGFPTNAIFGFIKSVRKLIDTLHPTHAATVWDGGLAAERVELLPDYKGDRPPMPAALEQQLDGIVDWLKASGIVSFCQNGIEADDAIAALARRASEAGMKVVIASSDKDFNQLVSDRIGLLNPNDKSGVVWTPEHVRERTGVRPDQVVDWLSLVGDSVDNIPGVPGVGAKTAAALLQQFGSCDRLFERIDEVQPARLRDALRGALDLVRRNQRMIRLNEAVPTDLSLDQLRLGTARAQVLRDLYERWGFRSMLAELEEGRTESVQGLLFGK